GSVDDHVDVGRRSRLPDGDDGEPADDEVRYADLVEELERFTTEEVELAPASGGLHDRRERRLSIPSERARLIGRSSSGNSASSMRSELSSASPTAMVSSMLIAASRSQRSRSHRAS